MRDIPAFPISAKDQFDLNGKYQSSTGGLTKRELIASLVMVKLARGTINQEALKSRAEMAVKHADALIEALIK